MHFCVVWYPHYQTQAINVTKSKRHAARWVRSVYRHYNSVTAMLHQLKGALYSCGMVHGFAHNLQVGQI